MAALIEALIRDTLSGLPKNHPDRKFLEGQATIFRSFNQRVGGIMARQEWMTPGEAAAYLNVHPKTLYRYVKAGMVLQHKPEGTLVHVFGKRI